MTPTAVTPAARRARPTTSSAGPDSRSKPAGRPSSLRSGGTPRASSRAAAPRRPVRAPPVRRSRPRGAALRQRAAARRSRASRRAPSGRTRRPAVSSQADAQAFAAARHRRRARPPIARRPAPSATPRARRRVSGPAGGVASLMAAGGYGTVALPAPDAPAPAPGAAAAEHPAAAPAAAARRRRRAPPRWPAAPSAFVASLPESSLLDRVIRGRIWIPLLGVLLVGIVGMQVENLKLNAGLGGAIAADVDPAEPQRLAARRRRPAL